MTTKEKIIFNGFHKITEVWAELKGKKVKREKLIIKDAVAGIVIDTKGRLALVTQYRPVVGEMTKEIPAGVLDKEGLTPKEILLEELLEECEISPEEVLSIKEEYDFEYYMVIGSSDAKISLYVIRVTEQQDKIVQDADVESVEWVDIKQMQTYIKKGLIKDPKTIIAYYRLKELLAE